MGLLGLSVGIRKVHAPYLIITIMADGSISPASANITTADDVTYTFTADINASIIVQRSNIVIDGSGWTLGGNNYAIMYGLNLTDVSNVTISNVNVRGFGYGIYLQSSTLNSILNNNVTFNEGNIYLKDSFNNTITGNTITSGAEAVQLYASSNNTISSNSMSHNYYGVWARSDSAENVISENNITGGNRGIFLDASSNNTMSGNKLVITFEGMAVNNSLSNIIAGNSITQAYRGVFMDWFSRYNTITRNNIDNNTRGIQVQQSHSNTIVGNNITRNSEYGVILYVNTDSTFYHNNFLGNTHHVGSYLPSVHVWDDGVEGNYWSNYTSVDANHDGLGDSPHVLDANNTDYYPLMGPFHSFNTSLGKSLNAISNSTVNDFQYESPSMIRFHVSNTTVNQTHGFCRVSIPYEVLSEPFNVTIDGANPTYWNYTVHDNGTHRWIYFEYAHSTREIVIIPESPSLLILPLFMTVSLLAALAYKRRRA
jgi:parallel beta-helix repeat protein